jgi:signal transduction histidine kinase
MKRWWSSLTVRLVVASLTWTAGLLYLAHLTSVFLLFGMDALDRFGGAMLPSTIVALASMVFGALIVRRALDTFKQLRQRVIDVHEGRERMVTGTYMREVEPVVAALNGLLAHQDSRVREAVARAGDLAHGLKTPLAVLQQEAARTAADGQGELAALLGQQTERMQRHIDYHLAHARASASGVVPGLRCSVTESAHAIARTLERLHAHRGLTLTIDASPQHVVRVQREDLDELLGNVLDNACKWARARVRLSSAADGADIAISVDDDGPGIALDLRDAVLQRGVRADEAAPGTGLGLAIVREIAELYQGSLALGESAWGGLQVRLRLPRGRVEHSGAVQPASTITNSR